LGQKTSEDHRSANPVTEIIRKGSIITLITLISRPLGYVREAIQAYLFGATIVVDAFIVSFNFPELIQTLFFSGATSAFLIPVCTKYMQKEEEYSRIYSTFLNLSIIVTFVLSLVLLLLNKEVMAIIAPGFNAEAKLVARYLLIIMIPVIALHTILSVMKAFLNAKEHFAAPEMSGILWNIAFIAAALTLGGRIGIYSLAVGVTAGSLLQVLMQLPYLRKLGVSYHFALSLSHPAVQEAKRLFAGALIATSVVPINSFVGRVIASYLPHGEVASLAYAFRVFILPFSLFAVPVYTVMFSKLSKLYHDSDIKGIFAHIDSSIILLCITLLPSTILLCSTGDAMIRILYERGAFTTQDTVMTNRALFGYGIGLVFYALSISFVRVFNALHDMKTPAVAGITSIVLNALIASILMVPLRNLGIALATSIVSFYNFVVLYAILKKRIGYRMGRRTVRELVKAMVAGIILVLLIFLVKGGFPGQPYLQLVLGGLATLVVYGVFFKTYYSGFIRRRLNPS
jgi:putative peptidoglycan lipid II flippase